MAFKTDAELQTHMRLDPPCEVAAQEAELDGFGPAQEKLLRSRKKTQKDPTEEEKWKDVYRILFPADDLGMIPSPCELQQLPAFSLTPSVRSNQIKNGWWLIQGTTWCLQITT